MRDITNNLTSFYTNAMNNKNSYSQEFIQSIKKYDTDNNGVIDENELNVYVQEYIQAYSTENLTKDAAKNRIFNEIQAFSITKNDTAKSGLNKVLNNAPIYNQGLVNSIKQYDTDEDGKLSDTEIANSGFSTNELENRFTSLGLITNDEGNYNNEASAFKTAAIQNAAEIAFSGMLQYPNAEEADVVNYVKTEIQKVAPDLSDTDLEMIANLGTQKAQVSKAVSDIANNLASNSDNDAEAIVNIIKEQYSEASNILSDEEILHIANVTINNMSAVDTAQVQEVGDVADIPLTNEGVRVATPRQLGLPIGNHIKDYDTPITQYKYQGKWHNVDDTFTIATTPADGNKRYATKGQFDTNGNLTLSNIPQYRLNQNNDWHDAGESFTITDGNKKWTNCSFDTNGTLSKSGVQYSYNGKWYKPDQEFTISSKREGDYIITKKGKFDSNGNLQESIEKKYNPQRETGNGRGPNGGT